MNQYQKFQVLQQKHLYEILIHLLFNNKCHGIQKVYIVNEQIRICLYFSFISFELFEIFYRDFKSNTARDLHRKHYTNDESNIIKKTSPIKQEKSLINERQQTSKIINI